MNLSNNTNQSIIERYVPTSIDDMLLAPATKERLLAFRHYLNHPKPTAWLLHGLPGLGKTTLARLAMAHLARSAGAVPTIEVGTRVRDEMVEEWSRRFCEPNLLANQVKVVWIDEADAMSKKAQAGLRTVIERSFRFNTHWLFTSNVPPAKFGSALKSRLHPIAFSDHGLASMIEKRLVWISEEEGFPILPSEALSIVRNNGNDIRGSLNELDRHISSLCYRATGNSQSSGAVPLSIVP